METSGLTIGYSPCPNDTFIFHALIKGLVGGGPKDPAFSEVLYDVEKLNQLALRGGPEAPDITKLSFHAYGRLRKDYYLLRAGGALGRGSGPLLVTRDYAHTSELAGKSVAAPGTLTTAALLLALYEPELTKNIVHMQFDRIMDTVVRGEAACGLIIHEGRFTYPQYGLMSLVDLGTWWEDQTGLPLPLGCIAIKRKFGAKTAQRTEELIRQSLLYARANPDESAAYITGHAQELEPEVLKAHIALYVNDFSVDYGPEGIKAIETLFEMAQQKGVIPPYGGRMFV